MKGAGGTSGGIGQFIIGVLMMCAGFYLLLNAITVRSTFGLRMSLYHFAQSSGGFNVTTGMVMIPFMFGIGMIFYNSKNWLGWILAIGSLVALIVGVITSIQFSMRHMTAFDLIVILVLAIGGTGLFLRSLRNMGSE